MSELLAEAWGEFVSIDGKVANTLRLLLLRPGELTVEYLKGRRARFLPPLRLYLMCSVALFLLQSIKPSRPPAIAAQARASTPGSAAAPKRMSDEEFARSLDSVRAAHSNYVVRRLAVNGQRVGRDGKNFQSDIDAATPRLLFILMPVFALLLSLAYRSRRRAYATHLIVALHIHAFAFAVLALSEIVALLPVHAIHAIGKYAIAIGLCCYPPLALRRVYGGRLWGAVGRTFGLALAYAAAGVAVYVAMAATFIFLY